MEGMQHWRTIRVRRNVMGRSDSRYPCQRLFTLTLPDDLFAEACERARQDKTSVSEAIRTLMQWGVDSALRDQ
jgi:hypothetical protein